VEGETFVNKHYIRIAFKYFCIMQSGWVKQLEPGVTTHPHLVPWLKKE
jgi:hypothetical protein